MGIVVSGSLFGSEDGSGPRLPWGYRGDSTTVISGTPLVPEDGVKPFLFREEEKR